MSCRQYRIQNELSALIVEQSAEKLQSRSYDEGNEGYNEFLNDPNYYSRVGISRPYISFS